ncbi:ribose-5-phosphate isomerase RpiA [Alcaligenes sp. SDU_A2]|uniref:ribose-5-phosphate isomerase RpiA n=1 Tax=Alcaligenes sp. SDU_A2 TaxID=3136634 RepID=UPI002BE64DA9|nr:ribose-5-phosphate isomerase RpiA [Alcaligenes sp.]HRL27588.1 ribose-5-phosphate isomerase RpiA [Alcaligenes sp.]
MYTQSELKQQVAQAAVDYILPLLTPDAILGVGTGSTVDVFIDALAAHKHRFKAAASSSNRSTERMQALGIAVQDLNTIERMDWYVDGADELDGQLNMTKGGGGALTREKIVASVADKFLCIVDESKLVERLGAFALPVEVIPMALNAVARQLRELGGQPVERAGFVTDNGGLILDVAGLSIADPAALEARINNIPGVICCGLFALKPASVALVAGQQGVRVLTGAGF